MVSPLYVPDEELLVFVGALEGVDDAVLVAVGSEVALGFVEPVAVGVGDVWGELTSEVGEGVGISVAPGIAVAATSGGV